MAKAQADEALLSRVRAAETSMTAVETWSKRCEDCEAAVSRGKEALAAGDRDEAAGHCRAAQSLLDGGLKSEALRKAVQELEQAIKSGHFLCLFLLISAAASNIFRKFWCVCVWYELKA